VAESRNVAITVALITAAATIVAAVIATWNGGDDGSPTVPDRIIGPGSASVFLNRDSGPGGSTVLVSGEGFVAGERVVISFHTEQIGSTTAGESGRFANVSVTIPTSFSVFAPQQFFIKARGEDSIRVAQAPFTITG
jgi:hypothetical protein